ncbi:calcyclin-binding protein-like [Eriocheir sinensis]|uniref:calcyclin-binding protein-like n=1 Tax=Eriocheir sinensis TaxID=95602 RepID=UPI0021C59A18|nr:calcyclin-binding protein-like [Eriocheir sinensis]
MANKLEEAQKDVEELRTLVASASRKRVQDMLANELRRMEIEVTQLQEAAVNAASLQQQQRPKTSAPTNYTVSIRNYSWDQSDKFTKLYLMLKNVQGLAKEAVTSSFTEKGVEVKVEGLDGKNHHLRINNLAASINPEASYHKVKTDMVVVLLAKAETGDKWSGVTAEDVKANLARQPKTNPSDPNGGIMDLMKQMYDDGDDKMKQMLNKTWYESQQKTLRGEPGEPGMPGMPGMGGMPGMPGMGGMPGMPGMPDMGL